MPFLEFQTSSPLPDSLQGLLRPSRVLGGSVGPPRCVPVRPRDSIQSREIWQRWQNSASPAPDSPIQSLSSRREVPSCKMPSIQGVLRLLIYQRCSQIRPATALDGVGLWGCSLLTLMLASSLDMKAEPMAPSLPYSICCRLPKDLLLVPKLL